MQDGRGEGEVRSEEGEEVMSKNSSCERHGGVRRSLETILGPVALVGELGF